MLVHEAAGPATLGAQDAETACSAQEDVPKIELVGLNVPPPGAQDADTANEAVAEIEELSERVMVGASVGFDTLAKIPLEEMTDTEVTVPPPAPAGAQDADRANEAVPNTLPVI
jgi:hypothetical protein